MIRETQEYKTMTPHLAVGYAEGFKEAETEEQVIAAWQYIVDKGLTYTLQGWFGRTAQALIEQGVIEQ